MAAYTVTGNDNMSALDLSTIENGTITTNNATTLTITATDGTVYTLSGNFTGGSGSTFPTGGTITDWSSSATDGSNVDITSLNLSVKAFDRDLQSDNTSSLLHSMFSGNDHFNATTGTGGDILSGYSANDTFDFGSTFGGTDAVNGGGGNNTVVLNGDYSSGLTIGSGALTDIQELQLFGDDTYNVTLASGAVSGVRQMVVDVDRPGPGDALNFNASAENTGFYFKLGGITIRPSPAVPGIMCFTAPAPEATHSSAVRAMTSSSLVAASTAQILSMAVVAPTR